MNESWRSLFFVVCFSLVILGLAQQQPQPQQQVQEGTPTDNSWLIYAKLDKCNATSTSPSIGSNGLREYAPENALSKGSGYWCSAGNHRQEDVVYWTGWLSNRRPIKGIEIHWAYAPAKVSVLASYDGVGNFRPVAGFQGISSSSASFDQKIFFPEAVRAKAIRIAMQGAPHEYIGINLVQLIIGNTIVRLQSGITSPYQEMCLVADESNEIVLDGCTAAIAAMDGRDIWLFTGEGQIRNPIKNSCIVLKENNDADGGTVALDDCFAAYSHQDGRSIWELQKNNQLKLMKGGNLCLSQKGSKSGSSDVAQNKQAVTSHPRLVDTHHGPEMALDGNADTYWASVEFPLDVAPDAVYLDVNLGDKYKLKSVAIDWVYPAMSYTIQLSKDGKAWTDAAGNMGNSLHNTANNLYSTIAQYIRVVMKKPHPTLARVEKSMLYGIRTLSVFSNRLKSIVEDCGKAATSKDSRDKFFLEMVSEVDLSASNHLRLANAALLNETATVLKLTENINELLPSAKTCLEDKKIIKSDLLTRRVELGDLKDKLAEIEDSINQFSTKMSSPRIGYTPENPAEDCFVLKSKDPASVSGFYYIRPPCSSGVLRVYCDMSVGASYFVPPENDISELNDISRACGRYGLKPVQVHNSAQIAGMHTMLSLMDIDLNNPVPIATKNEAGRYYDAGLELDVTDPLFKSRPATATLGDTAGIGKDGLVFFDGTSTFMSAIICSTNTDALAPGPSFVEISCGTAVKDNPLFNIAIGQTVIVKCPENCLEVETPVIGTDVYNEESSVCLAAVHSGVYNKNGLVVVQPVEGLDEFMGSTRNGVSSDHFRSVDKRKAFKTNQFIYKCPNVPDARKTTSFLEVNVIKQFAQMGEKQVVVDNSTSQGLSTEILDPKTGSAIKNLLVLTNVQYSSVDPSFLRNIQEEVGMTVSKARGTLKAAMKLQEYLNKESAELLLENKEFGSSLESVASKLNSRMYNAQQELANAMAERAAQSASCSWELEPLNENEFYDVFEVRTSRSAIGSGNWHMSNSAEGSSSGRTTIAQTSSVVPIDPAAGAVGTFLMLRNKRFFDAIFSADVYMSGTGSFGFAFRARGKDMYLFEARQFQGGFKRLLRVEDGKPTEVARVDDGGYISGKWYTVRIHTQQARIKISVVEATHGPVFVAPEPIIDIIDGVFASGTVGFFASAASGVHFANMKVEALSCVRQDAPLLPPRPPHCSNFRESFVGSFVTTWNAIEPENAQDGPSEWKYGENIGGERKVIMQTSSVKGVDDTAPTMAILKKNRSCDKGTFTFSFFPQCEAGIIGGVFNYKDSHNYNIFEVGPSFARLRRNVNGRFSTYTKSMIGGYSLSNWNKVTISMNDQHVSIHSGNGASPVPLFNLSGMPGEKGGSVGLLSYNCPGVAFSNVALHPHSDENNESREMDTTPATFVQPELSGMDVCLRKKNFVERMEYCLAFSGKYSSLQKRCKSNFCDSCCEQQFPVSSKARVTCKNHCHEADYISSLSESALQLLQDTCSIDRTAKFYATCNNEDEAEKESCLIQLCSMCCRTAKIPDRYEQSYYEKTLLSKECERRCATQQSIAAEFDDL